ncbi:MAG: endonuclease [Chloroflexi bacterium]|nr:endonuclease [Chloroflexota bacterium]
MAAVPDSPPTTDAADQAGALKAGTVAALLLDVYRRLLAEYGPQGWWPGDSPFEVCVGAVLTQAAAWGNVEKAIHALKAAEVFSPQALDALPEGTLARLIRPSGYFNAKARKLKAFVAHLRERYGYHLDAMLAQDAQTLRQELLSLYGIGEETADDIVLYAAGKSVFVIDAYTRRIVERLGLAPEMQSYQGYQGLFMQHLPPDAGLFNEYHALLVRHGKGVCQPAPRCETCCLVAVCATGRQRREPGAPLAEAGDLRGAPLLEAASTGGRQPTKSRRPGKRPTPGSRSSPAGDR